MQQLNHQVSQQLSQLGHAPSAFFTASADEVVRLVPIAAQGLGWSVGTAHRSESGNWRLDLPRAQNEPGSPAVISVQSLSSLGSAVRLIGGAAAVSTEPAALVSRERFFRALTGLAMRNRSWQVTRVDGAA